MVYNTTKRGVSSSRRKGDVESHQRKHTQVQSSKRQRVYDVIYHMHMMRVNALPSEPRISSIDESEIKDIIKELKQKGLIYSPKPGYVDCVD